MTLLWCVNEGRRSSASCFLDGHRIELRAVDPEKDSGWQAAIEADEARLSTSARARRQAGELGEVQHRLSEALSACTEMGVVYAAAVLENNRLRREVERLKDRPWIVARDGGRYCESCEQEVRRGEAYEFQPGTGGLMQHIHCPVKEATDG